MSECSSKLVHARGQGNGSPRTNVNKISEKLQNQLAEKILDDEDYSSNKTMLQNSVGTSLPVGGSLRHDTFYQAY